MGHDFHWLAEVYDRHADTLHGYLRQMCGEGPEVRDLLQEIFLRLARKPDAFTRAKDQRAFLVRMAHNLAVDHFRRRTSQERRGEVWSEEGTCLFETAVDPDEEAWRSALGAALAALPPDQRAVVHLKLWGELTFDQIARSLGISPNTAASRYRYGLDKLRDRLRPVYEEALGEPSTRRQR